MRVAWSILRRDSSCEVWQVRVVRQRKLSESRKGNKIKIISKAYYDVHVKQVPTFCGLYLYMFSLVTIILLHTVVQLTAGVDSTTGQSVAVKPLIGQLDCVPSSSFVCVCIQFVVSGKGLATWFSIYELLLLWVEQGGTGNESTHKLTNCDLWFRCSGNCSWTSSSRDRRVGSVNCQPPAPLRWRPSGWKRSGAWSRPQDRQPMKSELSCFANWGFNTTTTRLLQIKI